MIVMFLRKGHASSSRPVVGVSSDRERHRKISPTDFSRDSRHGVFVRVVLHLFFLSPHIMCWICDDMAPTCRSATLPAWVYSTPLQWGVSPDPRQLRAAQTNGDILKTTSRSQCEYEVI